MSLSSAQISIFMAATETILSAGGNSDVHPVSAQPTFTNLTDGTGANKAQKVGRKVFTLSTTPLDIDLQAFAGGINDAAINFSVVKQIYLKNLDAAIIITVGGTAGSPTNAWTNFVNGTFALGPGEVDLTVNHTAAAKAVAAGNRLLRVVAASGTPQMEMVVVGEGT